MYMRRLITLLIVATVAGTCQAQSQVTQSEGMGSMIAAMTMPQPPVIVADTDNLYILRGNDLLKIDKKTLGIIGQATLPAPQVGTSQGQTPAVQLDQVLLTQMLQIGTAAVAVSKIAVNKATHPELREFAQRTVKNQTAEIERFSGWLKSWYDITYTPTQVDQQLIDNFGKLSGRDFEIAYVQGMIRLHQMSIDTAQVAIEKAEHPELQSTASKVIDTQSREITELRSWLSDWYGIRG